MQEPKPQEPQQADPTVKQGIESALAQLKDRFDPTLTPEARGEAAKQLELQKGLLFSLMGDPELFDTGRRALDSVNFSEARMLRALRLKADPDGFPAFERDSFPRLTNWRAQEDLLVRSGAIDDGTTHPMDEETIAEGLAAGDERTGRELGIADLTNEKGELVGSVAKSGWIGSVERAVGLSGPSLVIDDEIADRQSNWLQPENLLRNTNTALILHGPMQQRTDGTRFVKIQNRDGSGVEADIPNLSSLRDFKFTGPDGAERTVHVDQALQREIAQSREGGAYQGEFAERLAHKFQPAVLTGYGEQLVPRITGNDQLDTALLRDPRWQRAVMDTPRPTDAKMFGFDTWKQAYGVLEFAGAMLATEGVAGVASKGAGAVKNALAATRAYRSVAPAFALAGESAKAVGKTLLAGSRLPRIAARIPGTYYDVRQIGEMVWYNAAAGMVNGHWEPGQWIGEGLSQGMGQYMLGGIARGIRHSAGKLLESGWLSKTDVPRWAKKFEPGLEPDLEGIRRSVIERLGGAKKEAIADAIKKGIVDAQRAPALAELVGAGFDSAFVGLGLGAYVQAHRNAALDGRSDIGVDDLTAALGESGTWTSVAGMLLGHSMGVGGKAVWTTRSKHKDDAVTLIPGVLGLELGPAQKKYVNDLAQHQAEIAMQEMERPEVAGITLAGIDLLKDSDFTVAWKLGEALRARGFASEATPDPVSGGSLGALVRAHRSDEGELVRAMQYESDAGLDRMYTTLDNARPGLYPAEWNANIRDLKDSLLSEMDRREQGGASGQALTGQPMKEREAQALGEYKLAQAHERKAREQQTEVRKRIVRTLAEVGQARTDKEAEAVAVDRGEARQARYDEMLRELEGKEFRRTQLLEKRKQERDAAVKAKDERAAKAKDAGEKKQLETEAKEAKRVAREQEINDRNASRHLRREEAKAIARAQIEKAREEAAAPSAAAAQDSARDLVKNLETTSEHAHQQGDPAAILDSALEGIPPSDLGAVANLAADAKASQDAKRAARPRGKQIREPEPPGEIPPASPRAQVERLFTADMAGHRTIGAQVFRPGEAGKPLTALKTAATAGGAAALDARFGGDQATMARGRARQESLAVGMLLATSLDARADELVGLVTQLGSADVAGIRSLLTANYEGIDKHIEDVLEGWSAKLPGGAAVLAEPQLRVKETRQLLRLIALGAEVEPSPSGIAILSGGNREKMAEELEAHVAPLLVAHTSQELLVGRGTNLQDAARAIAIAQREGLKRALAGLPKSGLRTEGLWFKLKKRVAYNLTGKRNADDHVEGSTLTVRQITDGIVADLSKKPVESVAPAVAAERAGAPAARTLRDEHDESQPRLSELGSGDAERARRAGVTDEVELARKLIESQATLHALSRMVGVRDLVDVDGAPLVHPDAGEHDARRIEGEVYRGLLDGSQGMIALLGVNGWGQADIVRAAVAARDARALHQELLLHFIGIEGSPYSGAKGEEAVRELGHVFQAFETERRGHTVDGEAKKLLDAGGWLDRDGRLKLEAEGRLLDLAREAVIDGLVAAEEAAGEGVAGIHGVVELREVYGALHKIPKIEQMYSGLGPGVFSMLHLATDLATGWYDRRLNKPWRAKWEGVSFFHVGKRGVSISMSALLDRMASKNGVTDVLGKRFGRFLLRAWVSSVSGQVRGVATSDVKAANYHFIDAKEGGAARSMRVLTIADAAMKRVADMNLSTDERLLISKLIGVGGAREIKSQAAWTAAFGDPYSRLYPLFLEVNDLFVKTGEELVQEGILDPARRDQLINAYLPRHYLKLLYGARGEPMLERDSENVVDKKQVGGFERAREGEADRDNMRRMYDIAYVLPQWASAVSQRMKVIHTLNRARELGVAVTRADYLAMPESVRWQWVRLASPGRRAKDVHGNPIAALEDSVPANAPESVLRDREQELHEREHASLEQVIAWEFRRTELEQHDVDAGGPPLTPKLRDLLDWMDTAYVPINTQVEIGMLIDQTDLGPSINTSFAYSAMGSISQRWRRLHTVFNPQHIVMSVFSNWGTNAATGKVPLQDILNPRGSYWRSSTVLGKWQAAHAAGIDTEKHADPQIRHAHRFMERGGLNTFASQFLEPVNGNDIAAGFAGKVQRRFAVSGATMSDTLAGQLIEQSAGSERAFSGTASLIDKMANGTSPESRAEALRTWFGMYGFIDLVPKYAAQIEGEKLGMDETAAYHWGTEGTGDFSDVNPRLRAMTTNFSLSHGPLYGRARAGGLGKGEKIGTARPGASTAARLWAWTEGMRMSGLGGPFWMYRATMLPALGRAIVNHPMKVATTLALGTFLVRAIGASMQDDPDEWKRFYASQAGQGSFLHANFDEATFDAYARRYGKAPAWGMGAMTVAGRDWVAFTKAYVKNLRRDDPKAGLFFQSAGPNVGGQKTSIDFSQFFFGASSAMWIADSLQSAGTAEPYSRPEGMGVAHLPAAIASVAVGAKEMFFGVEGKSRSRVFAEHLSALASEMSSPMAGLPFVFSREGQQLFGALAWDGRSLGQMIDGLPSTFVSEGPLGDIADVAVDSMLPMRRPSSSSRVPGTDSPTRFFENALGVKMWRDSPSGDPDVREAARTGELAKEGLLKAMSWAYRNAHEHGAPLGLWNARALFLGRDLDRSSGKLDVNEAPQTILGEFIRNASRGDDDRQALTAAVVATLKAHRGELKSLLEDPRGVVNRIGLPPEMFDRAARAALGGEKETAELVRLVREGLKDPGAPDADVWARLWLQTNLPRRTKDWGPQTVNGRRVSAINKSLEALRAAHPDMNMASELTLSELKRSLGAKVLDVLPSLVTRRPFNLTSKE